MIINYINKKNTNINMIKNINYNENDIKYVIDIFNNHININNIKQNKIIR